ncbi:MAG: hypothetical protein WDM96_00150 [Lacunisphaera sp.]
MPKIGSAHHHLDAEGLRGGPGFREAGSEAASREPGPPSWLSRRCTRAQNAAGVSPPGSFVHWTVLNSAGTSASASRVASTTTGSRKAVPSAMACVRCAASRHSIRK